MNARFYLPSIGRFASADTIVPDPKNSQTHNRYSYVNNNPINLVDPSGHFSEEAIWKHLWEQCSGFKECAHETYNDWRSDGEWWGMLRESQAGDVLYGTIDPYGSGIGNGSFFFQFEGNGESRLDGITFMEGDNSNIVGTGSLDYSEVTLFNIFAGQKRQKSSSDPRGYHIFRLIWNGVVNNLQDASPIWIRGSTARIEASEHLTALLRGATPEETMSAIMGAVAAELSEMGVCSGFGQADAACSIAYAALTTNVQSEQEWAYRVHSGPFTFSYKFNGGYSLEKGKFEASFETVHSGTKRR